MTQEQADASSDDDRHTKWAAAIVPYHEITAAISWRGTVFLDSESSEDQRKRFYEAVLEIPWITPKVRGVVMKELGRSLRRAKLDYEEGRTAALRAIIKERKTQLLKAGKRPRGGVYDAAVAEVAGEQGMTAEALKKRLHRDNKRRPK